MKEKPAFPKKFKAKLPPGFEDTANAMSIDEIKKKIVEYEREISSTEKDQEDDVKLNAAKELAKELSANYTDLTKMHQAMIKFLVFNLDERGAG